MFVECIVNEVREAREWRKEGAGKQVQREGARKGGRMMMMSG